MLNTKTKTLLSIASTMIAGPVMAQYQTVTTQDSTIEVLARSIETTSEFKSRAGLVQQIAQARLYTEQAEGPQDVAVVNVASLSDVVFPGVSLPPTDGVQHSLVIQLLGAEHEGNRQVTFSSIEHHFDIYPNQDTLVENIDLYLTKLTVDSELIDPYVDANTSYQIVTSKANVLNVTTDVDYRFTAEYEAGERPIELLDASGNKIADIQDDTSFGALPVADLQVSVNDGGVQVSAAFSFGWCSLQCSRVSGRRCIRGSIWNWYCPCFRWLSSLSECRWNCGAIPSWYYFWQ